MPIYLMVSQIMMKWGNLVDLKQKEEAFESLKKCVEPKSLSNLMERVSDLDNRLILIFGLLLSYSDKNDELDFLNATWE